MASLRRRRGRLIVIEGADGTGKATQSRLLIRRLRREGYAIERIAFPQYGRSFFGEMVARYLRGECGPARDVDPRLASVLYAADRWEARDRIEGLLAEGTIVVLDRYVDSNKAHQAAKLPNARHLAPFLKWVDRLEYGVFGLPRPDYTIYLRVPCGVASGLIDRKGRRAHLKGRRRDVHEADAGHQRRAERVYAHLAKTCPPARGTAIDCVEQGKLLSKAEITERIWSVLLDRGLLGGRSRAKRLGRR